MFSCASSRNSPLFFRRVLASRQFDARPLQNRAENSSSSSPSSPPIWVGGSSSGYDDGRRSGLNSFLRSVSSGIAVVGAVLGFNYWRSASLDLNSFCSFADFPKDTTWRTDDDGQVHCSMPQKEKKPKFLFGDEYRRRVFFNYEKRIRLQSPPEKVFEYFASVHTARGEIFMTPADLMRAVVPVFPPSESNRVREGFLRGEKAPGELYCSPSEFFMLFDTNNDGLISFPEYIFFVTLLSIPESSFSVAFKMFDLDNNGEIDREEFKKVMALMRSQNRQGARHRDGRRLGLKVPVENGGLVEYFFGKDGKGCLHHDRFVQFLRQLHDEILQLEFSHYDFKSEGTISAKDFALSLVASADTSQIGKLLNRVDTLSDESHLSKIRITFEEFKDFAELRKQLRSFSLAIFSYGKVNGVLTKEDFQRAASQVCGISITKNVIDIIYHVFDADCDGDLSSDEFVKVVQGRVSEIPQPSFGGFISCWSKCASNCSSSKLLL